MGSAVRAPGLLRVAEELIESVVRGLIFHRSIIKVRRGGRGLRRRIFQRSPVSPDIIRRFRRGAALVLSEPLLLSVRSFLSALLLSPFLLFRPPSTFFFPALTRGPLGPFSIFEILADAEAAQDNADEEAGWTPGSCPQEEKDRGQAKPYVGKLGVDRREDTILVAGRADILIVSFSGLRVLGADRTPGVPFADVVFFVGYVFVHLSITTANHCSGRILY